MVVFIKKASELKPKQTAKTFLHNHLSGFDPARSMKTVHASELTKADGFCPRAYALHDVTKIKPKDRWLSTSEAVTFQMGRDLERNVVSWFGDMGRAVCHWRCIVCGTTHLFQLRPAKCSKCGDLWTSRFEPKEVRLESAVTGASCGIDMLLALGGSKLVPYELKTIDKDEFKSLLAPLGEHRERTSLYLRIIAESDTPWAAQIDTSRAYILYVSKGGYGCLDSGLKSSGINEKYSPFKEFEVIRNDALTEEYASAAKVVKDFRDGKIGMPKGICSTALGKRAQNCPFKVPCFDGSYPPGQFHEAQ